MRERNLPAAVAVKKLLKTGSGKFFPRDYGWCYAEKSYGTLIDVCLWPLLASINQVYVKKSRLKHGNVKEQQ